MPYGFLDIAITPSVRAAQAAMGARRRTGTDAARHHARGAGTPERIIRLRLEAFDWNCQQHITPRFTQAEIGEAIQPLRERLARLEAENASLRSRLAAEAPHGRPDRSPHTSPGERP